MISAPGFSVFWQVLYALPLAWLWLVLINDLRVEWTVNPQYSYGWAVPFLCLFLAWEAIKRAQGKRQNTETDSGISARSSFLFSTLFVLLAFVYAPTRLVQEANPGWRLVSWALAVEVVGLTLIFIRLASGASRFQVPGFRFQVSEFVFPICFFLVAVPWPSQLETLVIQGLTRVDTACTTELLGWLGIPAMPHGNVVEVATGMVGIDEACSGIRSFQATLMVSLFLGEFYHLTAFRRCVLCLAGFALSVLFNLARMSLLVWVAARKGVAAIASWHDPAGVTILVACFFSLWGLGVWLARKNHKLEIRNQKSEMPALSTINYQHSTMRKLAIALGTWIVISEVGIEAWYRWHEARVPAAAQWTVAWPADNPTFKELPIAPVTRQVLRYDEGRIAIWQKDGLVWQAVFLRWEPGRTAMHLAQNHTPEVCFTAAGHTLNVLPPQKWFEVNGLKMPFLAYQVMDAPQPYYVFYCLWDDRASSQGFDTMLLSYAERLAPVMAGRRNPGQRSLEIAVTGPDNAADAVTALQNELQKLISSK